MGIDYGKPPTMGDLYASGMKAGAETFEERMARHGIDVCKFHVEILGPDNPDMVIRGNAGLVAAAIVHPAKIRLTPIKETHLKESE